jgi:hypothetical protein
MATKLCTTVYRPRTDDREPPNAVGYFVQNRHGATVAGPFESLGEAWAEVDRREPEERAALAVDMTASTPTPEEMAKELYPLGTMAAAVPSHRIRIVDLRTAAVKAIRAERARVAAEVISQAEVRRSPARRCTTGEPWPVHVYDGGTMLCGAVQNGDMIEGSADTFRRYPVEDRCAACAERLGKRDGIDEAIGVRRSLQKAAGEP